MQDSFQLPSNDNDNWLMYPGSKIESVCRLTNSALHFTGTLRVDDQCKSAVVYCILKLFEH